MAITFNPLGTVTSDGTTTAISISNIPQSGYNHLEVHIIIPRKDNIPNTGNPLDFGIYLNGDYGSNYAAVNMTRESTLTSTEPSSDYGVMMNNNQHGLYVRYQDTSNHYATLQQRQFILININNYLVTNRWKHGITRLGGPDTANGGAVQVSSWGWMNNAAVNRIDFYRRSTSNIQAGVTMTVFGI